MRQYSSYLSSDAVMIWRDHAKFEVGRVDRGPRIALAKCVQGTSTTGATS
jgi:hypothetical protein